MRKRLDRALVGRGLAQTRSRARDLIRRGCVSVDGEVAGKAGQNVGNDAVIEVADGALPYVSRAGLKLATALEAFELSATGRTVLDIGASTGGFTEVLLRAGAAKVYAVDVGRGQLHPSLRDDPRVISLEGLDARRISRTEVPEPAGAIVADVSFISLTKVLPAVLRLAAPDAWLIALVKPQFELEPAAIGKRGIVKDPSARERAVGNVRQWLSAQPGWRVLGVIPSPIAGGSGNQEFFIGARRDG
jgi:23S rRNA (cytidine1920-2'-O)/16S rRNA (cytidine1409-2'-O)-methyltransferase